MKTNFPHFLYLSNPHIAEKISLIYRSVYCPNHFDPKFLKVDFKVRQPTPFHQLSVHFQTLKTIIRSELADAFKVSRL